MLRSKTGIHAAASALLFSTHSPARAQSYDPATESPLILVTAPADPIAYYDARAKARALLDQKKAAEAEPLAERITREYPRDGDNWVLLAEVRKTLNKHAAAAAAYQRAGELLRWGTSEDLAFEAAAAHLRAGNKRAALDFLRRHVSASNDMGRTWLYDHKELVSLRSDPEFLEIAGRPDTSAWSRDYGWRRDLDFLREEVKRLNADYRNRPLPEAFERRYEELKEKVPQLSDEEIFVGMNRMLAVLRQGHTSIINPTDSRLPYRGLPFQMYLFAEGIFVVDAVEQHKNLIGSRVVSIEGVPAEEALRRINETQSVDGDNQFIFQGMNWLHSISHLKGLRIAKSRESIEVTLQKPKQSRRTLKVPTVEASSFFEPQKLMPPAGVEAPLFLREPKQVHWHQPLPDHDALYVQLNAVADEPDESLAEYAIRLRSHLAEAAPQNLILDMRHNPGGSTNSPGYSEFLRTMIGFSMVRGRRLYVLIGRRTYSAAGNLITELEQLAGAVFVGEASSECCTFYGSPSGIFLPFSRLRGNISTKRWSLSRKGDDFRREMNPHVPVITTARDYFAGRDPVMAAAVRMIERSKAAAPAAPAAAPAAVQRTIPSPT
jgi:tetratricopeptide (TPR) repeat protein